MRIVAAIALLWFGLIVVAGVPDAEETRPRSRRPPALDRSLQPGARVSVKGALLPDGTLQADEVELRRSDDRDEELSGPLSRLDLERGDFTLVGRVVSVGSETRITDEAGVAADLDDLHDGLRVKVDGHTDAAGRLEADRVRIYRDQSYLRIKVEGRIEAVAGSSEDLALLRVAGVDIRLSLATELVGKRGESRQITQRLGGVADDEELLFTRNTRLGRHVAMAGEVRLRAESLSNLDLDDDTDDEELVPGLAAQLGFVGRLGPAYGYLTVVGVRDFVLQSEDRFAEGDSTARVGELYVQFPLGKHTSLAIGRQKINDAREWRFNTRNLDVVRLFANVAGVRLEASISRDLFDESRNLRDQDLRNVILQAAYRVDGRLSLEGYFIDRRDRTELEDSPRTYGLRIFGDRRHVEYWIEAARQSGTYCSQLRPLEGEDGIFRLRDTGRRCSHIENPTEFNVRDTRAYAFDLGMTYRPRWRLDPTLTFGYAVASGEGDEIRDMEPEQAASRVASSFRQTGLQRNRWKYNGVVTFRYYGEVIDPELFNLRVWTLNAGFRPARRISFDLSFHDFRQDRASKSFHELAIDDTPSGESPDLGREWDIAFGYEPNRNFEVRLTAGVFRPGAAFDDATSATAVRFQTRFRF